MLNFIDMMRLLTPRFFADHRLTKWHVQVYMLKGKFLLALQATKRAIALEGRAHPSVHRMIVQLCHAVQAQVHC